MAAWFEVAGNRPLPLDDPAGGWRIHDGAVEVFLVERLPDGRPGTRQHLFGLEAGAVLLGLDTAAALVPVSLLAVGLPGTRVERLDRDALLATSDGAAAVDDWIAALSAGLARPLAARPRPDVLLTPGQALPPAGHRRISAPQGVVWCHGPPGQALFLDLETVAATSLPLTRDTWVAVAGDAAVHGLASADLVRRGELKAGLEAFHQLAVDVLPMALRLAAVDEVNRLRARAAGDRAAAEHALDVLAGVFGPPGQTVAAGLPPDQPLLRAVARLGQELGVDVRAPDRRDDEPGPLSLDEIARASRLGCRAIVLEAGWWRGDSGAFLLQREGDGRPLALWPGRRGYRVYDGVDGRERPLPPAEAAALRGQASSLLPPLPDRPLRPRDLLASVLQRHAGDLATLAAATLLAGVLTLSVPLALSAILDTVLPDNDLAKLWEVALALMLAAAMTFALRLTAQLSSLRIEGLAASRLQAAVMDRLLRMPTGFFRRYTTGTLAARVMAVTRLENALTATLVGSVVSGLMSLMSFALMLVYSPLLALVALALAAGLALAGGLLGWRRLRSEARVVEDDAQVLGTSLELAGGITKIRLAAAEDRVFLRWAGLYARASRSRLQAEGAAAWLGATTTGYPALATALLLAGAVFWGVTDHLSLGLLVAFLAAFASSLGGLATLIDAGIEIAALAPVARHAEPILAQTPEAEGGKADPGLLSGRMELSRLTFRYHAEAPPIFHDLSLRVEAGSFVAVVGPSGAGKSTLFRLLLGFEQPDAGMVMYDGLDLAGLDIQAVRRQVGVVLQDGKLMPGTLLDNILGANLHLGEEAAWDAAERAALADDILAMPMGMRTLITGGGGVFSGGQVQRILLARAMVARPRLLLLDEATSALDNRTQAAVTDSLNGIAATRLVIAHRLSTVARADRIVVLNNGGIAEDGGYDELMARNGFFAAFARRQLTG